MLKSVLSVCIHLSLVAIESISLNIYFGGEKTAENHFWKKMIKKIGSISDGEWKSKLTNWDCITASKNMWGLFFLHLNCPSQSAFLVFLPPPGLQINIGLAQNSVLGIFLFSLYIFKLDIISPVTFNITNMLMAVKLFCQLRAFL